MTKPERIHHILDYFAAHNPNAQTELHYRNPYELLVAVMLSAQCTDARVNQTTPEIFKRYPTPQLLAAAGEEEILALIKSISYPNSKAKHLKAMAQLLVQHHNGQVPGTMEELVALPGVGRKTANVILSVAFGEQAMAVDTHVLRVSHRLGLTTNPKNALTTEKELAKLIPHNQLGVAHHWLILHGRYVCKARTPLCSACGLQPWCKYFSGLKKTATS
jgi:endonuclease-3